MSSTNQVDLGGGGAGFQHDHGWREAGVAFLWGVAAMAPILLIGGWRINGFWRQTEDARRAIIEAGFAHEKLVEAPALPRLPVENATAGRDLFMHICAACHGATGTGMLGLGKSIVESDFVAAQDDAKLHQFIVTGRPDAKPLPMPPKGGRPELTDAEIDGLVAYIRGLQDPRRMPELPAMVIDSTPSEEQKAAALVAAGGDAELAGWIASGDKLFHSTCVACHGKGGVGMPGNGKALVNNPFVQSLDDDKLLAFVQQGRGPSDALNTTGIQMPPKGGNPALSEDDILDIISYLRTLQGGVPAKPAGQ